MTIIELLKQNNVLFKHTVLKTPLQYLLDHYQTACGNFSEGRYWEFDESLKSIDPDYPRSMELFRGVPNDVDSAMTWSDCKSTIISLWNSATDSEPLHWFVCVVYSLLWRELRSKASRATSRQWPWKCYLICCVLIALCYLWLCCTFLILKSCKLWKHCVCNKIC